MNSLRWGARASFPLLAAAWIGCGGPDKDALCQESEDCRNGNDKDVAACVANLDYVEDVSSDVGCSDEYDEYFTCFQDHATCESKNYDLHGGAKNACEAETNAFKRCANVD